MTSKYWPLQGGEHLNVPALKANPGWARFTRNYELDEDGRYRRIDGYERVDGRTNPSDATYYILDFDAGNAEMTAEDTVTGVSSSATGILLYQVLESGTYAGGDAAGYLVLCEVSGTFQDNENLQVSAVTEAVADGTATLNGADTDTLHDTYQQAAIEYCRDQITAVPGSGSILGVWKYNDVWYAFRNNSGGTACDMYKSSTSGWTQCTLGRSVAFTSGGTTEIEEDDTVTGATSGATAVVKRVILTSGTWAGGDAAGTFILYSQSGTFQSENLNVGAVPNLATIAGNSTANTLAASGRFEFINHNFGGHAGTERMYGCDGVSKAFEWDGSVFVPITTGMTTDTPEHIFAHHGHLFLSFSGGSVQHSSINNPPTVVAPYIWSVVTGANEMGMGHEVVGFFGLQGGVLGVMCRSYGEIIYGSSASGDDAWSRTPLPKGAGAVEWTGQMINNRLIALDDHGLVDLYAVQEYGDFSSATISSPIKALLDSKVGTSQCSMAVKKKNQYRLWFSDGTGIYMRMEGSKILGFTRVSFDDAPVCCCSAYGSSGEEELLFGDASGFVYQLDKGTSFDGDAIESFVRFHYAHLDSPQQKKRLRKLVLELDATQETEISLAVEFDYAAQLPNDPQSFDIAAGGGIWGVDDWDSFIWDGQDVGTAEAYIDGTARNFAIIMYASSTYTEPHTLQGVTAQYSLRGFQK